MTSAADQSFARPTPMTDPTSHDDLMAAVTAMIDASELEQVRLTRLHIEVAEAIPDEVTVEVGLAGAKAAGVEGDPDHLFVTFTHLARMKNTDGGDVAVIEFSHLADFRYTGTEQPTDEAMQTWVMENVVFMVYPYARQTLQQACMQVGVPPIVLGYLKRGELIPQNITVVVNKTQLADERPATTDGESAPEA